MFPGDTRWSAGIWAHVHAPADGSVTPGVDQPRLHRQRLVSALASFAGEYAQLAQVIQADLAQIGVTVNLKPMEIAAFGAQGVGLHECQ